MAPPIIESRLRSGPLLLIDFVLDEVHWGARRPLPIEEIPPYKVTKTSWSILRLVRFFYVPEIVRLTGI